MVLMKELSVEVLCWHEVRDLIYAVNKELAVILDQLELGSDCKFYKASYRYGDKFSGNGVFKLPMVDGNLCHINDLPSEIAQDLSYNAGTLAAGIVLNKVGDIHISFADRVIPFVLNRPGDLHGISLVMQRPITNERPYKGHTIYNMTAGARAVFMVPKISQTYKHKRLRRVYDMDVEKPLSYLDHFDVFRSIARHDDSWRCEMIFFGRKLFDKMHRHKWESLQLYLYKHAYEKYRFWSNQFLWDLTLSRIDVKREIKSPFAVSNFVKYIFALSTGRVVGLQPATDDSKLPFSLIYNAYRDVYQLDSAPIVMEPNYLIDRPIYTSIQFPTIDGTSELSRLSSGVGYLDDIRYHFECSKRTLLSHDSIQLEWTPIAEVLRNKQYEFFHSFAADYQKVRASKHLAEDQRFLHQDYEFNANQPFFNGCIKVSLSDQ